MIPAAPPGPNPKQGLVNRVHHPHHHPGHHVAGALDPDPLGPRTGPPANNAVCVSATCKKAYVFEITNMPLEGYEREETWSSDEFETPEIGGVWLVEFCPRGWRSATEGWASVYLRSKKRLPGVHVSYTISLILRDTRAPDAELMKRCGKDPIWKERSAKGWPDFVKIDTVLGCSAPLVLRVELTIVLEPPPPTGESKLRRMVNRLPRDVTLTGKSGHTQHCNATLLSVSSPVLSAMLDPRNGQSPFQESLDLTIAMEACDELDALVTYIEEDKIPELETYTKQLDTRFRSLITTADKYQIRGLVQWLLKAVTKGIQRDDLTSRMALVHDFKHIHHCQKREIASQGSRPTTK